jgi:hypothetical protein
LVLYGFFMPDSIQALIDSFGNAYRTLEQKDATVVKLCSVGASAVGPLMEAIEVPKFAMMPSTEVEIDSRQGIIQLYAARTLGLMGKTAAPAAPALADLFAKSRTSLIRREAAIALSRIVPVLDAATNAVSSTPQHWHVDVREAAAIALGALGPLAKNAAPQLLASLMDRSERIRDAAFQALTKIGPAAVPVLIDALRERNHIRAELAGKGTVVIGGWAMNFARPDSDQEKSSSSWHVRQRTEDCALLEKIFESGVQIVTKLDRTSMEFRAILNELAKADTNAKLQALAKDALAKFSHRN